MRPFEIVVREHGASLLRVCRGLVGANDSEDAWAETFLAALRAYPSLRPDSNIRGWLITIAHNKCMDLLRSRSRRIANETELTEYSGLRARAASSDLDLWRGIAALPERQRLAIVHHYFGGMSHAESAEIIGGSPESVRRAASDGLSSLRRTMIEGD